jgi:predicted PurR-regulated permease PerM
LAKAQRGHRVATALATRLAGERGPDFVKLASATVRSVATGIIGVALIQSILAGLGFLVAGVSAAGFWALLCLIFGILQIGVVIILIPMVIYVFSTADTGTAVVFLIYNIPVGLVDNILRPILLGRGVEVPMLVIFVGAIGGFLASGIVGLFVGPIVLAMGHELFMAWIDESPQLLTEPDADG